MVYDPPSGRVYVAHGDRLTVVDGRSGALIGQVEGMPGGTHGVAISHETGKGYTDDGRAGEVQSFDLRSFKILARIPVEKDADAIVADKVSGHVFVISGEPHKVSVLDPRTDKVVATIDTGEGLEYAAVDGRGGLYVAGEENRTVVRIDTRTNTVTAHWSIPDCASPHGLAIDVKRHRVFVSCVNQMLVAVDADTGRPLASAAIGSGTDAAGFDPKRERVFSANGRDGTVSVLQVAPGGALTPLMPVQTAVSGRTMDVDPRSGRLFVAAADTDPSPTPGGRAHPRPGTLKLLMFEPVNASGR